MICIQRRRKKGRAAKNLKDRAAKTWKDREGETKKEKGQRRDRGERKIKI